MNNNNNGPDPQQNIGKATPSQTGKPASVNPPKK